MEFKDCTVQHMYKYEIRHKHIVRILYSSITSVPSTPRILALTQLQLRPAVPTYYRSLLHSLEYSLLLGLTIIDGCVPICDRIIQSIAVSILCDQFTVTRCWHVILTIIIFQATPTFWTHVAMQAGRSTSREFVIEIQNNNKSSLVARAT